MLTVSASHRSHARGRGRRAATVDQVAVQIILQNYLDSARSKKQQEASLPRTSIEGFGTLHLAHEAHRLKRTV